MPSIFDVQFMHTRIDERHVAEQPFSWAIFHRPCALKCSIVEYRGTYSPWSRTLKNTLDMATAINNSAWHQLQNLPAYILLVVELLRVKEIYFKMEAKTVMERFIPIIHLLWFRLYRLTKNLNHSLHVIHFLH